MRNLKIDPAAVAAAERTLNDALRSGHYAYVVQALAYIREWEDDSSN